MHLRSTVACNGLQCLLHACMVAHVLNFVLHWLHGAVGMQFAYNMNTIQRERKHTCSIHKLMVCVSCNNYVYL